MLYSLARLNYLIDTRFSGVAKGVGTGNEPNH